MVASASHCRNCGEAVDQRYCPACGQRNDDRRGPLATLLGDFFSEFFSLDGRHLRTAAALLSPGKLTRLYLDGKRASYTPPVRVYLVASLLLFFIVDLRAPDARDFNVLVDGQLIGREERAPDLPDLQLGFESKGPLREWSRPMAEAKREKLRAMPAQQILDRLFSLLEQSLPTALIVFVPLLAAMLKLLYLRGDLFYVDQLVFALHFQSFLFLALVAARVVNSILGGWIRPQLPYLLVLLVVAPVYLLLALRRLHSQSWPRTVLKTAVLAALYLATLTVVAGATTLYVVQSL